MSDKWNATETMTDKQLDHLQGRELLRNWNIALTENVFSFDPELQHSIHYYFPKQFEKISNTLTQYGEIVAKQLEPLVAENEFHLNLPRLSTFDGIGNKTNAIMHHPSYQQAGNIIYGSGIMSHFAKMGGLLEGLSFLFISGQVGEAGHHCPIACSAGILRILRHYPNLPNCADYIKKLTAASYETNFTGAQFLTEVQGGSDVGSNSTHAEKDAGGQWLITGQKWFCSNADAELIFLTARYDPAIAGTKGLGLFLIPATLTDGTPNHFSLRRLKDKIGTRTLASAEIDFEGAHAFAIGDVANGFKLVMEHVLHLSRLSNSILVLAMSRRAYFIARSYAHQRQAFGNSIDNYVLVKENLARIKSENIALTAAIFAVIRMQDDYDLGKDQSEDKKLLLRLLANINKYLSSLWAVDHIHHAIDTLAGNGTIESFSALPRLFRDSIVCENWEGTHNTLRMQVLRDIHKYHVDQIFLTAIQKQIAAIDNSEQQKSELLLAYERLVSEFKLFHQSSEEIQTLLIKDIIDHMMLLFASLQLLLEARHQMQHCSDSKYQCLRLFNRLHLNNAPKDYDLNYIKLITTIIGA